MVRFKSRSPGLVIIYVHTGPLLWHWENNTTNDPSVELDLEEVKALAKAIGFEISVSEHDILLVFQTNIH